MCALHKSRRIGEVVETSTVQFAVECDELDVVPELGSFVRVGGTGVDAIYGIVAYAETTAVDPGRRVVRRGSAQLQDRALYEANPELRFVLRSLFLAVAMAYEHSGNLMFLVPPFPPPLHYSVDAVRLAIWRAGERARGAVLASDAFFPFPDSIEVAAAAGITAIIQPGGSRRDGEVIAAAERAGIAMVFTGERHFRH